MKVATQGRSTPRHADVVVVGAGTAGSILARRLVDAGAEVLLVEAGDADTNPAIADVGRLAELWHSADDWDYHTTEQADAAGRRLHLPRGKVVGGSHALNATIFVRGAHADFDAWQADGCPGWGWRDVLPIFKALEDFDGGANEWRGTGGPVPVVRDYPLADIQRSILDAAIATGLKFNSDYNAESQDGVSQEQVNIVAGRRVTTFNSFVEPVLAAPNLTLVTGAFAHRVTSRAGRVVGIDIEVAGRVEHVETRLVALAGGALDSPKLLLRSGIGPADELADLGIETVSDLPGVGRNLHDHLLSPVIYSVARPMPERPIGQSATQVHWFWRSHSGLPVPDTQPLAFSVPMYGDGQTGPAEGFSLMAGMISPASRGSLRLTSADPHDPGVIDLAALSEPADVASLVASVRQCREVGAAGALARDWGANELYPGPAVGAAELERYVRATAITYHHQVGTCRMGSDEGAVVSPQLAVRGVTGLFVADASVMPRVTTGNTNAPVMVIAERGAAEITSAASQEA